MDNVLEEIREWMHQKDVTLTEEQIDSLVDLIYDQRSKAKREVE
jgi:Spy/CpxP family protein refolding chaperone